MLYKIDARTILKDFIELEKRAIERGKDVLRSECLYKTIEYKEHKVYSSMGMELVYLVTEPHQNTYASSKRVSLSTEHLGMSTGEWKKYIVPKIEDFNQKRKIAEQEEANQKIITLKNRISQIEKEMSDVIIREANYGV